MNRQLRMGGGIMDIVPREPAILGGIKKAVKKVTRGVKKIASSDIGKAALTGAILFGIPGMGATGGIGGGLLGRASFGGTAPGLFNIGGIGNLLTAGGVGASTVADGFKAGVGPNKGIFSKLLSGKAGTFAALGGLSAFLTSQFGMSEEQQAEVLKDPTQLKSYLRMYYKNLNQNASDDEVEEFVESNTAEYTAGLGGYAEGGRIGFADGPVLPEFNLESNIIPLSNDGEFKYTTPSEILPEFKYMSEGPVLPNKEMASNMEMDKLLEALFEKYLDMGLSPEDARKKAIDDIEKMGQRKMEDTRGLAALGGKMDTASDNAMQAAGVEGLPVRQNPKGVKELDLRETGGFIPPVGIKEKEDDIPAMLSNNEFVFTADAVRGAGDGDVNVGAQRMYDMMKKLEAGGRV